MEGETETPTGRNAERLLGNGAFKNFICALRSSGVLEKCYENFTEYTQLLDMSYWMVFGHRVEP